MEPESKIKKIGVMGLGYIGLPVLAAFASKGCRVVGVDVDVQKIKKLEQSYRTDIHEPGVNQAFSRYKNNIQFTDSEALLMKECEAVIITVGTPVKLDGRPDFRYLDNAVNSIGKYLRAGQVIIFKSTIMPGVTRKLAERLEKLSGLKAGKDFYVVFCPERTAEGRALEELYTLPKVVGGINNESLEKGAQVIKILGGEIVRVSCLELAEMAKCIDNTYRVNQIAFANEVGEICEKAGLDSYELVRAVNKAYSRTNLFLPGLGAGGPCLSKDPEILKYFAHRNKAKTPVVESCIIRNREATLKLGPLVLKFVKRNKIKQPKIALLGLAFKGRPETDDIRNSPSLDIYNILAGKLKKKAEFSFFDPLVKNFLGAKVSTSLKEAIKDSHIILFLTNHPKLTDIDVKDIIKTASRPLLVVDCWHNLCNDGNLGDVREKNIEIYRIGDKAYKNNL